ncbi:MAG: hypothetical protein ACLU9S_24640 [Oscillospiraceae bacterium]
MHKTLMTLQKGKLNLVIDGEPVQSRPHSSTACLPPRMGAYAPEPQSDRSSPRTAQTVPPGERFRSTISLELTEEES